MPQDAFSLTELRGRRNAKWQRHPGDVIPCWVAEMDFRTAPPVQAAMRRLVDQEDWGYPQRDGQPADLAVNRAFVRRMQSRFQWETDAADVIAIADLVQASFAAVMAYSEPGDNVVLQTPTYPPFRDAITVPGRRLLAHPLRDDGSRWVLDLDRLAASIDARTRLILFCHPHNPTGRVYGRDELEALGRLAIRHDLVIVSDEIHADLIYPGHRHIPMASISPEVAARTVTITSATKSFNIPGLRCGVMHFGSPVLKARFEARIPRKLLGQPSITGIDATVAAWDEGQPWLDRTLSALQARRTQLIETLQREVPTARLHAPEATYLAWIGFGALNLGMPAGQFFLEKAGVAGSPGEGFDAPYGDYLRLNFATSAEILDEILTRMVRAIRSNSSR